MIKLFTMSTKTINNIPCYEAKIGEEGGCYCVSLVDFPAVEQDFIYFKNEEQQLKFAIQDEEQRKVTGVIMRADFPIYRIGTSGYEYYIVFSKEVIEEMTLKMLKEGLQNNISIMHNGELIEGVSLLEIFQKDSEKGINPKGFEHIEEGSLFGTYKVESNEVWDLIKSGEVKGFSIEVVASMVPVEEKFNKEINKNDNMKTKLQKIKNLISEMLFEFASVTTDKGVIYWDEGEIAVDMEVYVEDETGEKVAAADGDYVLEDGTVVKVTDGKVAEIVAPAEETVEETVEPETEENVEAEAENVEENVEPAEETVEEVVENKELDEALAEIERLKAEIETLNAKIKELEDENKALKEEDAAETVEEQFKKQVKDEDRLTRILSYRK